MTQIFAQPIASTTAPRLKSRTTFAAENVSGVAERPTFNAETFSAAHVPLSATAENPSFAVETFSGIAEKRSSTPETLSATAEAPTLATESRTFRAEKLSGAAETFSASQRSSLSHRDSSPSALYAKTGPHA